MTKRILSVLLAVLLALSCFGFAAYAENQTEYLVIGDSIGYGYGVRNPDEGGYGAMVAMTNGYSYTNDSIPGHRTQDLLARLENEKVAGDVAKADIISISIGGNDYLVNNFLKTVASGVKGDYTRFHEINEQSKINLDLIITKIKELNPDCTILMQTLYNPCTNSLRPQYQYGVDLINKMVYEYKEANPDAYEIADVASAFEGNEKELIAADGIHPNAKGNVVISKVVLEKLAELGLGTQTEPQNATAGIDRMSGLSAKIYKFMNDLFMKIFVIICKF